jgi:hypothetical protein
MENVYTCVCGNQTWIVMENAVRCTICHADFDVQLPPVREFNQRIMQEIEEQEV